MSSLLFSIFSIFIACLIAFLMIKIGEFCQKRIQFLHDPVYVPSQAEAVQRMIQLSRPQVKDRVCDLGSGNGRLVIDFAKLGCQTIGYEIDPFLVWESKNNIQKNGVSDRAQICWKSFWLADLSQVDILLLFMTASIMEKLELKLRAELKPGAKVVSQRFPLPHWKPEKKIGDCYLYIQK